MSQFFCIQAAKHSTAAFRFHKRFASTSIGISSVISFRLMPMSASVTVLPTDSAVALLAENRPAGVLDTKFRG